MASFFIGADRTESGRNMCTIEWRRGRLMKLSLIGRRAYKVSYIDPAAWYLGSVIYLSWPGTQGLHIGLLIKFPILCLDCKRTEKKGKGGWTRYRQAPVQTRRQTERERELTLMERDGRKHQRAQVPTATTVITF